MKKQLLALSRGIRWRWVGFSALSLTSLAVLTIISIFAYSFFLGPPLLSNEQNTIFYSHDEKIIGVSHGPENRYWVELNDISPYITQATLVTEDKRFYDHHGFDLKRIAAAVIKNITSMSRVQGASTISQQYARNLYLSHEKTWERKIKEAFYAVRLEMFYSKDKILEGYLNTIYFGHGNYGIEAASRYYFNKNSADLSLSEAALLAGIPKGPKYYSPFRNFENAKHRQEHILSVMAEERVVDEREANFAKQEIMHFAEPTDRYQERFAPYFQDYVIKQATNLLNIESDQLKTGGYHIYTTLDLTKQQALEQEVSQTIAEESEIQVAGMSIDSKTGAIVSLIGGRDYRNSPFNRAIQAKRMPGSTFKPLLYYAALGHSYTPSTTLLSRPTYFELSDGTVYEPSNFNGYYAYEPITMAQALAISDNVYAVKTNMFLGPETLVETARTFGISSHLPEVPSLALGTASVSIKEMTSAYSLLANGGKSVAPYVIEKITDSHGNVLYKQTATSQQVLDPAKAFVTAHLMTGMFDQSLNDYSAVTGASIAPLLTRQYAGKSGSTKTDSWMIGYSPQLTTTIWTGYDLNKPMELVKENQYAKNIWANYMETAHEGMPFEAFQPPDGVEAVYIDPSSGKLATPYCDTERLTYFVKGTAPREYCMVHQPEEEKEEDIFEEEQQQEKEKESRWDWFKGLF